MFDVVKSRVCDKVSVTEICWEYDTEALECVTVFVRVSIKVGVRVVGSVRVGNVTDLLLDEQSCGSQHCCCELLKPPFGLYGAQNT